MRIGATEGELVQGDITQQDVDAVVNAANCALSGGGGVDGAIHRAGGPLILEECLRIKRIATGQAVRTTGGNLKARHVIHAVGPVYTGQDKDRELLALAYFHALRVAAENKLRSIAFPSISTGAYRYPIPEAAPVALASVTEFLGEQEHQLELVRFVLFDAKTLAAYKAAMKAEELAREFVFDCGEQPGEPDL